MHGDFPLNVPGVIPILWEVDHRPLIAQSCSTGLRPTRIAGVVVTCICSISMIVLGLSAWLRYPLQPNSVGSTLKLK